MASEETVRNVITVSTSFGVIPERDGTVGPELKGNVKLQPKEPCRKSQTNNKMSRK